MKVRSCGLKYFVSEDQMNNVKAHYDRAMEVIRIMPKDDAIELGKNIVRGELYHEYGTAALVSMRRGHIGELVIWEIWARQDMTQEDKQKLVGGITMDKGHNDHHTTPPPPTGRRNVYSMDLAA